METMQKNDKKIAYLSNINLGNYLVKSETANYELFAVVCHEGNRESGQYWTLGKNAEGAWYEFKDSERNQINENEVMSEHAYILCYERT